MSEIEKRANLIARRIREYAKGSGRAGAVIGLSGGLDSAVCALVCSKALGGKNVLGLIMPNGWMDGKDEADALAVANLAGMRRERVDIRGITEPLEKAVAFASGKKPGRIVSGNIAARARMALLYGAANSLGYLVVGTGNKSEILLGYFTKHGDGGADILPIGDLYKSEVVELAKFLGVPERIVKKKPSAGLWKNQTDEKELGFTYDFSERVLRMFLEGGMDGNDIIRKVGGKNRVREIYERVRESSHKRAPPRILSMELGIWK